MVMFALLTVVALGAAFLWRRRRIERLDAVLDSRLKGGGNLDLVAGGAVTVLDALYRLSRIDGDVIDAIDAAHGGNDFDSANELVAHINDAMESGGAHGEGLVSLYKGHLGEARLADALRARGHNVELAPIPNQEGWDALVDGQPVQFKVGLDPSGVEQHLAKYPDIPVVTVAEHAGSFADGADVMALPEVSGGAVEETTRETLESIEGIDELGKIAAIDIPIVTFGVSTYRNGKRVVQGRATVSEAAKDTAVDVGSVGVGSAIGAKAGATLGLLLGPIGAGALGLTGGIAGAVGGRIVAKTIYRRKLARYELDLEENLAAYSEAVVAGLNRQRRLLDARATRLRPAGLNARFNPTLLQRARARLAERFAVLAQRCATLANRLRQALDNRTRRPIRKTEIGRTLLAGNLGVHVWSSGMVKSRRALRASIERLVQEQKRLFGTRRQ